MDVEDIFPLFAIAAVVALGLAIKAMVDAGRARRQLASLTEKFYMFDHRLVRLAERLPDGETAPAAAPAAQAPPPTAEAPPIPVAEPQPVPITEPETEAVEPPAAPVVPEPPAPIPEPAYAAAPPIPQAPRVPGRSWEQVLVEHWLVWLGGATLALGGAFLVKLSIDYGLLVPGVRVALAIMLGIGLCVGAEWLAAREPADPDGSPSPSYVPPALAAAGSAMVFASIYAAYALYEMIPGGIAFVLLAATAIATVVQSLRRGQLVAAVGLVGAYVVPMLVSSDAPHALPLFTYLIVVTAASLALLRHRAWWWLAWVCLTGAVGWVLVWLGAATDPETPVVGVYLLLLLGLVAAFRFGVDRVGFLAGKAETPIVTILTRCACWAIGLALFALAHVDVFGHASVAPAVLASLGLLALAYRDRELDDVIAVAGVLALAMLATWDLPTPNPQMDHWVFPVEPDRVAHFSMTAIVFVLMLGGGVFALLPKVARPGRWAVLSAAIPPLVLAIAYWRLQKFQVDMAWSMASLLLAAVELGAAAMIAPRRNGEIEYEIALASYAVGVLASTIFAATLALSEAWLTVALALHLPAMGWIESRIRLPALRWLALGIAVAAVVRLILNPYVLQYPLGTAPFFNWLLYGYGVPAAAFILATRQFGSSKDDALVWWLEAGSCLFLLAFLTLELIHLAFGKLSNPVDDFGLFGGLVALWLAFAAGMLWLGEQRQRPVLRWGGVLVAIVATVISLVWQPVMLIFGERVGEAMIFDKLLITEALPAAIFALIAMVVPQRRVIRTLARLFAVWFGFWWVTLEIQHAFHDKVWLFHSSTDAEWYAYSVAWLVFAGATLGVGLWRGNQWVRRAGLVGLALVIGKVFLSDMAELDGLLRALSFMGLGGALIGLGYAYRRFRPVAPPPEASSISA